MAFVPPLTLNQYAAGGVALQLANAVGLSGSAMNQYYATGGMFGLMTKSGGCSGATWDQFYASGGVLGQFLNLATGTTGVTGLMAAAPASEGKPHGHAPRGPRGA